MKMKITDSINGCYVLYSPINQAYFLMWQDIVLAIYTDEIDALYWWKEYTR